MTDFKKLKVVELRAECAARSLTQTGKRDELIERLEEYEFHNAEPSEHDSVASVQEVSEPKPATPVSPVTPVTPVLSVVTPVLSAVKVEPHPAISPIQAPTPVDILAAQEEEKRRLRALRFGLDTSETAPVKIEVTIKRLEHALPNRHHRQRHHKRHFSKQHRQISINKP